MPCLKKNIMILKNELRNSYLYIYIVYFWSYQNLEDTFESVVIHYKNICVMCKKNLKI